VEYGRIITIIKAGMVLAIKQIIIMIIAGVVRQDQGN